MEDKTLTKGAKRFLLLTGTESTSSTKQATRPSLLLLRLLLLLLLAKGTKRTTLLWLLLLLGSKSVASEYSPSRLSGVRGTSSWLPKSTEGTCVVGSRGTGVTKAAEYGICGLSGSIGLLLSKQPCTRLRHWLSEGSGRLSIL